MTRVTNIVEKFLKENYNVDLESEKVQDLIFDIEEVLFVIIEESFKDGVQSGLCDCFDLEPNKLT